MIKSVLKLAAVSFFAIFGEPTYLWRVGVCLAAGAFVAVVSYLFWPGLLPMWPGVAMVLGAAAMGVLWEWLADRSDNARLQ